MQKKKKEKNNKSHSCLWSVSRVDGSLHSLCSSCGKFKVIFFANSVFFCLLTHAPDLLHGQPRAYIYLSGMFGRLFMWTFTREIERGSGTF